MTTVKSFTSLEQSKKLAEILPVESADMYFSNNVNNKYNEPLPIGVKLKLPLISQETPCWSLAALLEQIPDYYLYKEEGHYTCIASLPYEEKYSNWHNNPVDACYEMILKLHEQNLL